MNSRERVIAALERKVPDRVPMMDLFIDQAVIQAIAPGKNYFQYVDESPQDMMVCELFGSANQEIDWIDKDKRIFRDKWGSRQQFSEELMPLVINPPRIETETDLVHYTPPDPNKPHLLDTIKDVANRYKGQKALAFVGETGFAPAQYLRAGLENLMFDFIERPELVKKLARIGQDYYIELYRKVIKEGIEIIILGDDYAGNFGTFVSPADFEAILLPGIQTVVREIKRMGVYCVIHTCGNIWKIIDMLVKAGVDGLGPLQPDTGMDLAKVKERYGDKICVVGNLQVDHLCRRSRDQVARETRELLARVSPGGGHILSSSNSITSAVRPENFLTMMEVCETYGKYPISI